MLAAAVPARRGDRLLELGAGVGTASLCLAARVAGCSITGVEIDEVLCELANENAAANGMAQRVQFTCADALALPAWLRRDHAHVFCNPPFHAEDAPKTRRGHATHDEGKLGLWLEAGLKRVAPRGTLTMIIRADRLRDLLARAPEDGVSVYPLWPHGVEPAKRLIVQVRKGVATTNAMLPGLVLHEDNGRYTAEADAVLRGAALRISAR